MSIGQHQRMVGAISASILICSSFAAFAWEGPSANINLAVASNFYGVPPSNSAITDLISAFEAVQIKLDLLLQTAVDEPTDVDVLADALHDSVFVASLRQ